MVFVITVVAEDQAHVKLQLGLPQAALLVKFLGAL